MNKAILMSIQPKWLVKILNGDKTIEIRKTMPKCELPIDVYLYSTKDKSHLYFGDLTRQYETDSYKNKWGDELNGKVVAKFTLNKVEVIADEEVVKVDELLKKSCLIIDELFEYMVWDEKSYAYHIDNLVIFDKPMQLSEFYKSRFEPNKITDAYEKTFHDLSKYRVTKAPQSWQYVYVKGE